MVINVGVIPFEFYCSSLSLSRLWNAKPSFVFVPATYKAFVSLCVVLAHSLSFAPSCLLFTQVNPCGSHEDVSGFIDGRVYALYTSEFHFCQTQTPIITTELWGSENCLFVWVRATERKSLSVRESSGGAMWYRWGPSLVFVWNQAWCLVSSANISSARLPLQLHSKSESSIAAVIRLFSLFLSTRGKEWMKTLVFSHRLIFFSNLSCGLSRFGFTPNHNTRKKFQKT